MATEDHRRISPIYLRPIDTEMTTKFETKNRFVRHRYGSTHPYSRSPKTVEHWISDSKDIKPIIDVKTEYDINREVKTEGRGEGRGDP
jgi:hypothetical protein